MTGYVEKMTNLKYTFPCSVGLPNGKSVVTREKGSVVFDEEFTLKNVLFVPDLKCNLISVSQLVAEMDLMLQIANKGCVIQARTTKSLIGAGELRDGLYFFRRSPSFMAFQMNKDGAEDVWHQRLGHPSNGVFDLLPLACSRTVDFSTCDVCLQSKQCRQVFPSSDNKSSEIFELIHIDVWGPYRKPSICNSYYFLTIVDDFSRGVWVFLLRNKSQVGKVFRDFMAMVERQFQKKIKMVRSDNGTEFNCLKNDFDAEGIIHQTSCVGTPQQNGRVERKHRHILNVARALMFQSGMEIKFWGEAILTAAHLINRTPSSVLKGKTPYEIIYGKSPDYDGLKVFGCLAFAHNQKRDGDKFVSRSRRSVFIGYPYGKKGWSLFDLETEEIFVSRDVIFVEDSFPFTDLETKRDGVQDADFYLFDDEVGEENQLDFEKTNEESQGTGGEVFNNELNEEDNMDGGESHTETRAENGLIVEEEKGDNSQPLNGGGGR